MAKNATAGRKKPHQTKKTAHGLALKIVTPLTYTQKQVFEYWLDNHLVLHGIAGTGKTFCALYLALREVLEYGTFDRVVIVRSAVPTRDVGFMPGSLSEKLAVYEQPYMDIVNDLCGRGDAYSILRSKGAVEFMSTSFLRGLTLDRAVVIVDEMQNLGGHELDSITTRIGASSKLVFAGDYRQTDLIRHAEKAGLASFLRIFSTLKGVETIEFHASDICRSGLVKQYILRKLELEDRDASCKLEHHA